MNASAYDRLAPHYRAHARTRAAYCDAVDRLVLAWRPPTVRTWLDVGAGDGVRSARLAASVGVERLVLSDPSAAMAELCRLQAPAEVWQCRAQDLPSPDASFDLITCLWNVIGSMGRAADRLAAVRAMAASLAPGGRLVLDVHNRYNVATAGIVRVGGRLVRDRLRPSETNGLVRFAWQVDAASIPTEGYLFARGEMEQLAAEAGLVVEHRAFVDYDTGRLCGPWTGQLALSLSGGGAAADPARRASSRHG